MDLTFALFISFLCPRFAPGLSCVTYTGDKEERAHLQRDLQQGTGFHVLLTTYEVTICFPSKDSCPGPKKSLKLPQFCLDRAYFRGSAGRDVALPHILTEAL